MIITECTNQTQWNNFVTQSSNASFLQSWEWGEFLESTGQTVWRFFVVDNDQNLLAAQVTESSLKLGQSFFYIPHGPIASAKFDDQSRQAFKVLIEHIDELAKKHNALYLQVDPMTSDESWQSTITEAGFLASTRSVQPKSTLLLDLEQSTDDILANMHSKTRYNIRLAERKGVSVAVDNTQTDAFHQLLQKTAKHQGLSFAGTGYFQKLLKQPFVYLYLAEYDQKVIAANIMVFWNKRAIYLFGGTDRDYRKVMAPQLLQWRAISDAKEQGYETYDFWGAASADASGWESRWAGVTRFKQGFVQNQDITKYNGTFEKVYSPLKLKSYMLLKKLTGKK